jgi:hypothetical protein
MRQPLLRPTRFWPAAATAMLVLVGVGACERADARRATSGTRAEDTRLERTVEAAGMASLASSTLPDSLPDPWAGDLAPPFQHPDPPALAMLRAEPVLGRTGPGGETFEVAARNRERPGHDRRIGRRSFEISLRSSPSTTDACGSCHRPGREVIGPDRIEDAHRYVRPHHPNESGTHCITCHAPDDVERLVLASGEKIGLDHAYRLCAQCHYAQVDDWAAGVHGKRLDGWRGRRVVMGCAECHDPHSPAVAPRMPFPGPQLPTNNRRSP